MRSKEKVIQHIDEQMQEIFEEKKRCQDAIEKAGREIQRMEDALYELSVREFTLSEIIKLY